VLAFLASISPGFLSAIAQATVLPCMWFHYFPGVSTVAERPLGIITLPAPADLLLFRTLTSTSISVSPLAPDRQAATMPQAPVRSQIHEPLDVHGDFTSKITLDLERPIDNLTDLGSFHLGELIRIEARIEVAFLDDLLGACPTDPMDVRQRNLKSLIFRQVNSSNTSHDLTPGENLNGSRA
jgi:hypothetical protein